MIFSSLNLDSLAKINDRSLPPFSYMILLTSIFWSYSLLLNKVICSKRKPLFYSSYLNKEKDCVQFKTLKYSSWSFLPPTPSNGTNRTNVLGFSASLLAGRTEREPPSPLTQGNLQPKYQWIDTLERYLPLTGWRAIPDLINWEGVSVKQGA